MSVSCLLFFKLLLFTPLAVLRLVAFEAGKYKLSDIYFDFILLDKLSGLRLMSQISTMVTSLLQLIV